MSSKNFLSLAAVILSFSSITLYASYDPQAEEDKIRSKAQSLALDYFKENDEKKSRELLDKLSELGYDQLDIAGESERLWGPY